MSVHSTHGRAAIAAGHCQRWASRRRERRVRAGFDEVSAAQFDGARGADLHPVLDLVARGCPPPLATRIFAPLTDHDRRAAR